MPVPIVRIVTCDEKPSTNRIATRIYLPLHKDPIVVRLPDPGSGLQPFITHEPTIPLPRWKPLSRTQYLTREAAQERLNWAASARRCTRFLHDKRTNPDWWKDILDALETKWKAAKGRKKCTERESNEDADHADLSVMEVCLVLDLVD